MLFYFPPLFQAASAAGRRSVLSYEDRMSLHRRLLSVVGRFHHSQSLAYEILGMPPYGLSAFLREVLPLRGRKMKPRPKFRSRQPLKRFFCCHGNRLQIHFSNSS